MSCFLQVYTNTDILSKKWCFTRAHIKPNTLWNPSFFALAPHLKAPKNTTVAFPRPDPKSGYQHIRQKLIHIFVRFSKNSLNLFTKRIKCSIMILQGRSYRKNITIPRRYHGILPWQRLFVANHEEEVCYEKNSNNLYAFNIITFLQKTAFSQFRTTTA